MHIDNVFRRNLILFLIACVGALSAVLIGERSYWKSAGVLNELSAPRAGSRSLRELRARAENGQTDIQGTLLLNRIGMATFSLAA